jgi:hypothetical protein
VIVDSPAATTFHQFWLLLERNGTHLMTVDTVEEANAFVKENGLVAKRTWATDDTIYIEIASCGSLADFYTWSDVMPGQHPLREVWRPFVWSSPDIGCNEALEQVEIGPKTVAAVLRMCA